MTDKSRILRGATLTMLALGLVQTNAYAETKTGDMFGDWAIECHQAGPDKNTCVLTQTVVDKDKKQKLLKIILGQGKDDAFITTLVPLGISIPAGVSVTLDQGKAIPLTVQTCLPQGCVATTRLDNKIVKSIKSGEKLAVSFIMKPAGKSMTINGSLKGIKEGLKAINL